MPSCGAAGNRPLRTLHLTPKMKSTARECLASNGLYFKSLGTSGPCPWVQFEPLHRAGVRSVPLACVEEGMTHSTYSEVTHPALYPPASLPPSFFFRGSVFISTTEIKCSLHLTLYFFPLFPSLVVVLVFVFVVSICTPVSAVFVCFHCLYQYGKMDILSLGEWRDAQCDDRYVYTQYFNRTDYVSNRIADRHFCCRFVFNAVDSFLTCWVH